MLHVIKIIATEQVIKSRDETSFIPRVEDVVIVGKNKHRVVSNCYNYDTFTITSYVKKL